MGTVIYREFHNLGRLALGLGILSLTMFILSSVVEQPAAGWLAVMAIFTVFPLLFAGSIYWMNRISLTPTHLVVGSETFDRSDFDFSFGVQPPLVLNPDEQAEIESRWKVDPNSGLRIAGGSWGRRIGTAMVVLRQSDGRGVVAVFTRRPEVLDPLLTQWLETIPETGDDL